MILQRFNITNKSKRNLSRLIKAEILNIDNIERGNFDDLELGVFYKGADLHERGNFFIGKASQKQELELKGNVFYNFFSYNRSDGKITLEEIEKKIFG